MKPLRLIAVVLCLLAFPGTALAAPKISIFYYPWYGNPARDGGWIHWLAPGSATADIQSSFYPARGLYSSSSVPVVRAQMQEIAAAGVQEVVSSWWGWGSPEDLRLPMVVREANRAGMSVAVHLEPYPGRSLASMEADIEHLMTMGISRFYVYRPFDLPVDDWVQLRKDVPGITLYAQTALAGKAAAAGFDGLYTYDVLLFGGDMFPRLCAQAHRVNLQCLPSVGPGYDATHATADLRVKPRNNGKTYDHMWRAAIDSSADGVTITSYNEWHEGTQIEPARPRPHGSATATYQDYSGAYGLTGKASEDAYLQRTSFWSEQFLRSRLLRPRVL